jgi:hypothetical protein
MMVSDMAMSKKIETNESYSYDTSNQNNNINKTNDFKESVNRSLDGAKATSENHWTSQRTRFQGTTTL